MRITGVMTLRDTLVTTNGLKWDDRHSMGLKTDEVNSESIIEGEQAYHWFVVSLKLDLNVK